MSGRWARHTTGTVAAIAAFIALAGSGARFEAAQAPSQASQPQPPAGGRGAPPPPRAGAPVDLTGTWVAVVTEDWQWRMRTPPKGDYASVQNLMTPLARQQADAWDVSKDGMCQAYGVGGLMRMPLRLKIAWQDDTTLKIESDAGQQTRLLKFATPGNPVVTANAPRTLQGSSVAEWQRSGAAFDAFLERGAGPGTPRWGSLKVVTTNMLPGWLRRNGVPYGENATVTEYFTRFSNAAAGDWFIVTTVVEDPQYLTQPFITSSNFKKEANDGKWAPVPCT